MKEDMLGNKKKVNKMTKEEKLEWESLYKYVKEEILRYPKEITLPRYMILRLKGLKEGKFIANKSTSTMGEYSFKNILYTFKFCKFDILQYLEKNKGKFNNEQHKFNGIMIIVESKLNDVILKLNNAKSNQEKVENLELKNQIHEGAKFKREKTNNKINNNLSDLW